MSAELDCYWMSPEERADFEACPDLLGRRFGTSHGRYIDLVTNAEAETWAACAKLYRERLSDAARQRDDAKARLDELIVLYADKLKRQVGVFKTARQKVSELEAENERLRADVTHLRVVIEGRSSAELSLGQSLERADKEIAELRAENVLLQEASDAAAELADENHRLGADAARYAFLRDDKSNSLHLTRNGDHACNYMTAEQWIEEGPGTYRDVSPGELEKMKDTNTIWCLQIYPNTPIGFNVSNGASLDYVVDEHMKGGE